MSVCPDCGTRAMPATGADVYPHRPDLASKKFWICPSCPDTYVGCHPGTDKPLGRLANRELRGAKMRAHAAFDPLWKGRAMRRRDAYAWLAAELGIDVTACHVGEFDVATCDRVVAVCALRKAGKP